LPGVGYEERGRHNRGDDDERSDGDTEENPCVFIKSARTIKQIEENTTIGDEVKNK